MPQLRQRSSDCPMPESEQRRSSCRSAGEKPGPDSPPCRVWQGDMAERMASRRGHGEGMVAASRERGSGCPKPGKRQAGWPSLLPRVSCPPPFRQASPFAPLLWRGGCFSPAPGILLQASCPWPSGPAALFAHTLPTCAWPRNRKVTRSPGATDRSAPRHIKAKSAAAKGDERQTRRSHSSQLGRPALLPMLLGNIPVAGARCR